MGYYYKKEFFREWYEANSATVTKEALKVVLGTSSNNNLQYWLGEKELPALKSSRRIDDSDRGMLPLRCILRLCNHYGLHLSDFIGNAEEPKSDLRGRPSAREMKKDELVTKLSAVEKELTDERLNHAMEVNAINAKFQEREDRIRADYDRKIQMLIERIPKAAHRDLLDTISQMAVNDKQKPSP